MDVQSLVSLVNQVHGMKEWDLAAIIQIGGVLAAHINSFQGLTGLEKQKVVLSVIKICLTEAEKKESSKEETTEAQKAAIASRFAQLRSAVDDVLPSSLELAVSAARGKVDLKKVKPSFWVSLCSCFASSAVSALAGAKLISEAQAMEATGLIQKTEGAAMAAAASLSDSGAVSAAVPVVLETQVVAETQAAETLQTS